MKVAILVLILAVSAHARPLLAPLYQGRDSSRIPGRYIVTFKDSLSREDKVIAIDRVKQLGKVKGLDVRFQKQYQTYPGFVVEMNAAALKAMRQFNEIAYVEEDSFYSISVVTSWGLDRVDQRDLPLDDSFTPRDDGTGVNVYIIDTGIRITHIDFDGRAEFFYDALRGNGNDCNGHGTHCAGTAAGSSYGVAKSASLWAVRVLSCIGFGSNSEVIDGMDQVASFGITPGVASMSLGGSISISLDNTVNILKNAGFTVVVAAGNSNDDACNYSPSRSASAITVGATTTRDSRATYSNYGQCVDIFAPGSDITSAWHTADDATNTISGTSMACPHVAGAAAVLLGMDPSMSHEAVKAQLLQESSIDKVTLPGSNSPNTLLFIG